MKHYEPDDPPAHGEERLAAPAPILPLFLGIGAAVLTYVLWGIVGLPLVGVVGGIFTGAVVVALLLWRARPVPPIDDE